MNILAHAPFIGTTGYANHSRSFFCALNKYHKVKVRNFTVGSTWKGYNMTPHNNETYLTKEMKDMLHQQTLFNNDNTRSDFPIYNFDAEFKPDVHIVLMETDHHYFYDEYDGYKIAYNVWETTLYPEHFFQRLFYFDEVWVPSKWQFDCLVNQGYPKDRIFIVPEGVDIDIFKPLTYQTPPNKFTFLLFGRWDYRKSTAEILKTFTETFKDIDNVQMICSIENPYPNDGLTSTKERLEYHNIDTSKLKILNFPSRDKYINYLKTGDVFVSCARSEGWNLPLNESLACGTPSIYSNWGGQLEFAEGLGIPVNISGLKPANIERKDFTGEYCEPDFNDLGKKMLDVYNNYEFYKSAALKESEIIRNRFTWDNMAQIASKILTRNTSLFAFVTTGDIGYMPVIEKLVQSLNEFSEAKIIVYGVNCDAPFDYPNLIKRRINPPYHSVHDKWFWKQYACIESLHENYDNFVWIDGDVVVNYNIDNIRNQFLNIENYPLSDIHVQDEFFGIYGNNQMQYFNGELVREWDLNKTTPHMHICFYIYNKKCKWWFEEILINYKSISLDDYPRLCLWNDEGLDNAMRWKYGFKKHLPHSNYDTSSFEDLSLTLHDFYKFWNEPGPQNFNRVFGYQTIPKDKSNVLYFHGNKNPKNSDKMIEFIKLKRDNNFHQSGYFYTDIYKIENLGSIADVNGGTLEIAEKYGWSYAIYHEIYNLKDYCMKKIPHIYDGDIVVDLGGNIGVFNRWAYSQGANKVISFEPDKRYFKLLKLNSDPKSILFNSAVSNRLGSVRIYESDHLGGSNLFGTPVDEIGYDTKSYTLDYLFYSGLVNHIDFLKVDVEGSEHLVFEGISDENLLKVRDIAIEYHHSHFNYNEEIRENLIERLIKLGFNSYVMFMGTNNAAQMIFFTK